MNYLNGPGFIAWLEETLPQTVAQQRTSNQNFARQYLRWTEGYQVTMASADFWLTEMGIPLSWAPEDLYEESRRVAKPYAYSGEFRRRALHRVAAGELATAVARDMGCSSRAIYKWRETAAT